MDFLNCSFLLRGAVSVAGLLLFLNPFSLSGQDQGGKLKPVSRTYAITGATVIPSPGKKLDKATVVIKNGLILAVGSKVSIPPEAIVVAADSMYVYAGFIDGFSHTGVQPLGVTKQEKVKTPGNPPPERAGITPQNDVRDFFTPSDKTVAGLRGQGFAVAQVAPRGNPLPGRAAVVLLGDDATDEMVLVGDVAMYSELSGTGGVYPSTVTGVMAKWRELYRQAALAKAYEASYAANPVGRERPKLNRLLKPFYPVIDKQRPVLFKAEKVLDIQRVFSLQNELNFRLMVAGVKEAWPIVDKVKRMRAGLFLSLDIPKEMKKDAKKDSADADENKDEEKASLKKRQQEAITNYTAQAATLFNQGVRFGFSTDGVKSKDIRPHLRRIIAAGLSEKATLAALTTTPARLLGLSNRLGTIEKGKVANLVISDKPYFEEKAKVKYVFVDGKQYKVDEKKKKGKVDSNLDVGGTWTYTSESPAGKITGVLILKSDDEGSYSGTITNSYTGEESEVQGFSLEDDTMSFIFAVTSEGDTMEVSVAVSLEDDGDSFEGTMSADDDSFPMEGTKKPESTL